MVDDTEARDTQMLMFFLASCMLCMQVWLFVELLNVVCSILGHTNIMFICCRWTKDAIKRKRIRHIRSLLR